MDRIATATKAVDLFGAGKHGFTGGNPNGSVPATKLSSEFCNAVQESLCRLIELVGVTLDATDHDQFKQAVYLAIRDWRPAPTTESGAARTWVTENSANFENWLVAERTISDVNRASGGTATCDFEVLNDGGFGGEVEVLVMRTDLATKCARIKWAFQGVCQAGTVTINASDLLYDDFDTLAIDTHDIVASSGYIRFRAVLLNVPAGKKYNVQTAWRVMHIDGVVV